MKRRIYSPGDWVEEPISYDVIRFNPNDLVEVGSTVYTYTGEIQQLIIPNAPGYRVRISAWGAAGMSYSLAYGYLNKGGCGGYAEATYTIGTNMTPGVYWVVVGQSGGSRFGAVESIGGGGSLSIKPHPLTSNGATVQDFRDHLYTNSIGNQISYIAYGGDYSGVGFGSSPTHSSCLVIAGGGGGAGAMYGGGGGGNVGGNALLGRDASYPGGGFTYYDPALSGGGGTQTTGGVAATLSVSSSSCPSEAGMPLRGGGGAYTFFYHPLNDGYVAARGKYSFSTYSVAGGGGGYYGGGAGGPAWNYADSPGGGGGGSSYTSIAGIRTAATLTTPGNSADPRRFSSTGQASSANTGGHGQVIVDLLPPL